MGKAMMPKNAKLITNQAMKMKRRTIKDGERRRRGREFGRRFRRGRGR